ncbi:MAG: hypothetical protein JWR49_535 [Tardiphaga sp.]|nr:hypothetical protein [Tardiphaga sp.]
MAKATIVRSSAADSALATRLSREISGDTFFDPFK